MKAPLSLEVLLAAAAAAAAAVQIFQVKLPIGSGA